MELLRALGALVEGPGDHQRRLAEAAGLPAPPDASAHTDLFRLQLPPYASIYLGAEGMLGGEARDRAAGFWRAMGAVPPPEPDHLATLLAAHASLMERDGAGPSARSPWRAARHAFFWEHLASWLPRYLQRVGELGTRFHAEWAALLTRLLAAEAEELGPPVSLPAALAAAPPLDLGEAAEVREAGVAPQVSALLAPARSGVVLTRADLAGAARRLGLGLRQGERRFALRALIGQDPAAVLRWLAGEARRQAATPDAAPAPALAPVADHWRTRALETAAVLERLVVELPLPTKEMTHA